MKTPFKSIFLSAAAAALAFTSTQAFESDPFGYISLDFQDSSDTAFSLPLHQTASFTGSIDTAGLSGFTITPDGAPDFTANEFTTSPHYVIMMDGAMEGMFYEITANDTNTLTVEDIGAGDLSTQGLADGQSFQVIPYWTLDTLFPNGEGFVASSDPFSPVCLVITADTSAAGINNPLSTAYFYYDGSLGGDAGWYEEGNLGAGLAGSTGLTPDNYYVVRNLSGSSFSFNLSGSVRMADSATVLSRLQNGERQDNHVGFSFPTDLSLQESGLFESAAFESSSDPFNPGDLLVTFDNTTVDTNKPLGKAYFYYDGSLGGDAGWYEEGNLGAGTIPSTEKVLKAGAGFVIRKAAGLAGSNVWQSDPPYDSN